MGTSVLDPDGTPGVDCDYTNIDAWVGAKAGVFSAPEIADMICSGGTAYAQGTIDGATTTAANKWQLIARAAYRNDKKSYPSSGNYVRVEMTNDECIIVSDNYCDILGVDCQITQSSSVYSQGVRAYLIPSGGSLINVGYCYMSGVTGVGSVFAGVFCGDADATMNVYNCVFTGFGNTATSGGIYVSLGVVNAYNCTADGQDKSSSRGFHLDSGTLNCYNCVAFRCYDDFDSVTANTTPAGDDGDGVTLDGSGTPVYATEFTDAPNGDYSLPVGSACIGVGTDNPGSGLYSDDIAGTARSSTWDIGAFEYAAATTVAPTTLAPTTLAPTTLAPTTAAPTTAAPTTAAPTTLAPTTLPPTTLAPTTLAPTTAAPTTLAPTTAAPTTLAPTTAAPTTAAPTTLPPTTLAPTTLAPTTLPPTTLAPTTAAPTTLPPTTLAPTTLAPTTLPPTTVAPTTPAPTTLAPTTLPPTTLAPTTLAPTTLAPTTLPPTTAAPTTAAPTTTAPTTLATSAAPTTLLTTVLPTTAAPALICVKVMNSIITDEATLLSTITDEATLNGNLCW